jgi:triacylglycerol lipase
VSTPTLVVHGLWDNPTRIAPLVDGLRDRGIVPIHAAELSPSDGSAPLSLLAKQVAVAINAFARETRATEIDIVGFSMGALVTRACLVRERASFDVKVRRFVSISGPHKGSWNAFALGHEGIRDMRPGSAFLRDLEAAESPLSDVEVHCLYTPWDLMILPPRSGILAGARSVTSFPIRRHRLMVEDPRVYDHIASILLQP